MRKSWMGWWADKVITFLERNRRFSTQFFFDSKPLRTSSWELCALIKCSEPSIVEGKNYESKELLQVLYVTSRFFHRSAINAKFHAYHTPRDNSLDIWPLTGNKSDPVSHRRIFNYVVYILYSVACAPERVWTIRIQMDSHFRCRPFRGTHHFYFHPSGTVAISRCYDMIGFWSSELKRQHIQM